MITKNIRKFCLLLSLFFLVDSGYATVKDVELKDIIVVGNDSSIQQEFVNLDNFIEQGNVSDENFVETVRQFFDIHGRFKNLDQRDSSSRDSETFPKVRRVQQAVLFRLFKIGAEILRSSLDESRIQFNFHSLLELYLRVREESEDDGKELMNSLIFDIIQETIGDQALLSFVERMLNLFMQGTEYIPLEGNGWIWSDSKLYSIDYYEINILALFMRLQSAKGEDSRNYTEMEKLLSRCYNKKVTQIAHEAAKNIDLRGALEDTIEEDCGGLCCACFKGCCIGFWKGLLFGCCPCLKLCMN